MVKKRVAILLTLFIFGNAIHAWCDPVKTTKNNDTPLKAMKIDGIKALLLKKAGPANEPADSSKGPQTKFEDGDLLRILEEKMRFLWQGSWDEMISIREFSRSGRGYNFFGPPQLKDLKSSGSDSGQSILKPPPDEEGYFGDVTMLRTLRLLSSREETLKKMFMGLSFSLDLTYGHLLLEMNVTPSSERKSGFIIHF